MPNSVSVQVERKWLVAGVVALVVIAAVLSWQFVIRPAGLGTSAALSEAATDAELAAAKQAVLDELASASASTPDGGSFTQADLAEITRDEFFDAYVISGENVGWAGMVPASQVDGVRADFAEQDREPETRAYYFRFQTEDDAARNVVTSVAVWRLAATESSETLELYANSGKHVGDWVTSPIFLARTPM